MTILTQVHKALEPDALNVVFIHGLNGDARSTWMHNPKDATALWPNWIGEEVGCNVWVAGYGAALSGWTDAAMHLSELGEGLFAALQVEQDLQGHRIVLVGHSLGGLVIKSGMTQAQALGDPLRVTLLEQIVGVVFVGTPHQGSNLATVADKLRLPLRTNAQVTNMVSDDAWLKLLNGQFRYLQVQRNFDVRVFFESKGVFIGRRIFGIAFGRRQLIVDRNSSDPGIAGVTPTAIDADHIEIAKPKSRQAFIHKALVKFLKGTVSDPESIPSTSDRKSPAPWRSSTDLPAKLRSASAALLRWPSTLADGTWLHRPELDSLIENLVLESSGTHFLLGDPGCGKSSLLVRLAQERQTAGWYVLALKADRLPPEVLDRQALAKHLNLETDTANIVRTLARSGPVLVLIDQVDALADLLVQHSARLRVLLDLVHDLSEADGVHTVISCRTFEQKHDPALRNLDAKVIRLELPEWSTVQPILMIRGILQADLWNQDIQQVLRSPHALEIFLSLLSNANEPEVLRSFQWLLEKQWETQVLSDTSGRRRTTLHHLAKLMAEREELGLALVQVEDHYTEIHALAAAGLLRLDQGPGRVEFRHQTLYEFVRARSFLEERGSLTVSVLSQQNSLRVRPQLWHALGYFRSASPEDYGVEINQLWSADLRPHLKMLLIEFLGLQTRPTFAERQLIESAATDLWFMPRFIAAAVGSPGWFNALLPTHLPRWMLLPGEQAQILLPMLRQALHFSSEAVVDLVRRHWLNDQDRDGLSWQALGGGDVAPQTGLWLDSLVLLAGRGPIDEWAIGHLAGVVSAAQPEESPRLIAAWLKRQIDVATAPLANPPKNDETAYDVMAKNVQAAFESRHFHDMEAIAEAAPRSFVIAMWPLLLEGLQLFVAEAPSIVMSYRQNIALMFDVLDDEHARYERPLLRSFQLGIQGWANSDPESFLEFVTANAQSELLFVHRLLAQGLIPVATHSPQQVFNYLCGDPRRFVLGPYTDVHKESVALIAGVCSLLDEQSYAKLESILRNWNYYSEAAQQDDAGTRQRRQQWGRQHRLRLLRALPEGRRSAELKRLVCEEERAFPGITDKDVNFSGFKWIASPVSAQQMDRATDADILNLFNELTDDVAWDHPRHTMKGGAIKAGRELADLAKCDLDKVLRIIRSLDPDRNEIPVSCTLRQLIPAGLNAPAFYSLVAELEDKGFVSAGFRRDAAYAIENAACKETPVPDGLIDRMERWLTPCTTEDSEEIETDTKETSSPILWGHGSMAALPNGNYPTLIALKSACLSVEPPRFNRWLHILEGHATRAESSRVWEALFQRELTYVGMADRSRVETLIDQVIAATPSILSGRGWTRFVAHAIRWASVSAVRRWLIGIVEKADKGQQGAGELACLRHALFPAEDWSRELVMTLSSDAASDAGLGVTHTVAYLWHEPMTRPVVHPILLLLIRSNDERVLTALSAIFMNDGFAADAETTDLLDALVAFPSILKKGRAIRLPEMLAKLVASEPYRVCAVANALLDAASAQMINVATPWHLNTEWLLDIALQLQDMGADARIAGSKLFERMLEFNIPQAREMTLDLDKRMPAGSSPRASIRRRSRAKPQKAL